MNNIKPFNKFNEHVNNGKILICDKNTTLLRVLKMRFEKEGYDVVTVENGRDALDIINNDEDINLLITELLIPFLSGYELINIIKNENKLILPVLIISNGIDESIERAFKLGADDYVSKPFSVKELVLRSKKLLNS